MKKQFAKAIINFVFWPTPYLMGEKDGHWFTWFLVYLWTPGLLITTTLILASLKKKGTAERN